MFLNNPSILTNFFSNTLSPILDQTKPLQKETFLISSFDKELFCVHINLSFERMIYQKKKTEKKIESYFKCCFLTAAVRAAKANDK